MVLSMQRKTKAQSAARLSHSWYASLSSHMQKSRFSNDAAQISELKQILYQPIIILISFKPKPETLYVFGWT